MEDVDEGDADADGDADMEGQDDDGEGDNDEDEGDNDDEDEQDDGDSQSHSPRPRQPSRQPASIQNGTAVDDSVSGGTNGIPGLSYRPSVRPEAITANVYDIVPTVAAPQGTSINTVTATPDMRWVFSGGSDGYIRKFSWPDTANGKLMLTVAQRHPFVDSVTKAGVLMSYWENEDSTSMLTIMSRRLCTDYRIQYEHPLPTVSTSPCQSHQYIPWPYTIKVYGSSQVESLAGSISKLCVIVKGQG